MLEVTSDDGMRETRDPTTAIASYTLTFLPSN